MATAQLLQATQTTAPQKEYGRSGRSIVTVTPQSVSSISPTAYQSPDPFYGGSAVSSPSNIGHGNTSMSLYAPGSAVQTCMWQSFPNVSGLIQSITLKFDYTAAGSGYVYATDQGDFGSSSATFVVHYTIDNGYSWLTAVSLSSTALAYGPDAFDSQAFSNPNFPSTTPISVSIPANTPLSQIKVSDYLSLYAVATGNGGLNGSIGDTRVENVRLEVVTDTTAPDISNVAAAGVTTSGATITWTTNENSDSQVEYGTTTAYGQSTALNPAPVTAHSRGLSGLTSGTLYHYRVRSRDAAGNLAVSGDFTFTTAQHGSAEIKWLVTDHLGSTRMVIDETGSLGGITRHDFLPFGEELSAGIGIRSASNGYSGDSVRQKFGSKEHDIETGFDYFIARYYSSVQGRFTSVDPGNAGAEMEYPQAWNGY